MFRPTVRSLSTAENYPQVPGFHNVSSRFESTMIIANAHVNVQNENAAHRKWNKHEIQRGKISYFMYDLTINFHAFQIGLIFTAPISQLIKFSKSPSFQLPKTFKTLSQSGACQVLREWTDMPLVFDAFSPLIC